MRVYRYMCEAELRAFLDGDISKIGTSRVNNASNTHHYKQGVKYLHFFKRLDDLNSIRDIKRGRDEVYYIGAFDIPLPTLLFNSGVGYYAGHGYDNYHETVREYAVPAEQIKSEYLVFYVADKNKDLTKDVLSPHIEQKRPPYNEKPIPLFEQNKENISAKKELAKYFTSIDTTPSAKPEKTEDACQ